MKNFFIVTNLIKDPRQEHTKMIRSYLEERGSAVTVLMRDSLSKQELLAGAEHNPLLVPDDTDCILVLGGDGTLLQAARDTLRLDIPLLGIKLGSLGFLAEVEKGQITQALDHLLADEYFIEERMLLSGRYFSGDEEKGRAHALNDIVITRNGPLMVVPYEIKVNGNELTQYHADGVILSTPTGSTGYNLSAGGPIVDPKASLIVMTPICPHTIATRSVVLAAEDEVEITFGGSQDDPTKQICAMLNFDGGLAVPVGRGDRVVVHRSERKVKLIRLSSRSFVRVLQRKLREG